MYGTAWFTGSTPWGHIRNRVLPDFVQTIRREPRRRFHCWSAVCDSGQEAYGLAMLIDRYCERHGQGILTSRDIDILGTDSAETPLSMAARGVYSAADLRHGFVGEQASYRRDFFESTGTAVRVVPRIAGRVRFERRSLRERTDDLGQFDLILVPRQNDVSPRVLERLCRQLTDRGRLFVGGIEATPVAKQREMLVQQYASAPQP